MKMKNKFIFLIFGMILLMGIMGLASAYQGQYTGIHFDTNISNNSFPIGITQNGTFIWITDYTDNQIYKYYMNGTFTGTNFSSEGVPTLALTNNNTYIWGTHGAGDRIIKYYMNGTFTGDIILTGGDITGTPFGITNNNTFLWVTDSDNAKVFKYFINGAGTGTYFNTSSSGNANPTGITTNNIYFWIADSSDFKIYKYYMNGTYTGSNFNTLGGGVSYPIGITQNGTYFFITDYTNAEVYLYSFLIDIINQTNSISNINLGYNQIAYLTFTNQNYFNVNATSILLQITNPDNNITSNISLTNPIEQNTHFLIFNSGNISTELTFQFTSEGLNHSGIITPYACNVDYCIVGNTFLLNITDTSAGVSPTLLSRASDKLLGILPDANGLTFIQKLAISFLVLFAIDILILLIFVFVAKQELSSVFFWLISAIDVLIVILLTAIGYFPLGLLIGLVALGVVIKMLSSKGR